MQIRKGTKCYVKLNVRTNLMTIKWYKTEVYPFDANSDHYYWIDYEWQMSNGVITRRAAVHSAKKSETNLSNGSNNNYVKEYLLYTSAWHSQESECKDDIIKNYQKITHLNPDDILYKSETDITPVTLLPFYKVARENNLVLETVKQMENALKIDPNKVVVVCISGYQFSSLSEYEKKELINDIKNQMTSDYAQEALSKGYDIDLAIENLLKQFGGSTGMQTLRNEFVHVLGQFGVPPKNIIHANWTERNIGNPFPAPLFTDLVRQINGLNPIYLAIFGHSFGACTASRVSNVTNKVPDFLGLVNPIFHPAKINLPEIESSGQTNGDFPRAPTVYNWYQNHWPIKGFAPVKFRNGKRVDNISLNDKDVVHWTISDYRPLHVKALNIVSGAVKSLYENIEDNEITSQPKLNAKL